MGDALLILEGDKKMEKKDIILIKVTNDTQALVLEHGLYYSCTEPDKDKFRQTNAAFIIGEKTILGVPLVASCTIKDIVPINNNTSIHSDFIKVRNGKNWKHYWELEDIVIFNQYNFLIEGASAIQNVTSVETVAYISSEEVLPEILSKVVFSQKSTSSYQTSVNNRPPVEFNDLYKVGDIIEVEIRVDSIRREKRSCQVCEIEEIVRQGVLENQKLTLKELSDPNGKTYKYMATTLRKK